MKWLHNASISLKLNLLSIFTVSVAIIICGATSVVAHFYHEFSAMRNQMSAIADIVGANCSAAIEFDDPAAAERLLFSLSAQPSVLRATVHDSEGNVFAEYLPDGASVDGGQTNPDDWRFVTVDRPIERLNETLGHITVTASLSGVWEEARSFALFALLTLLAALGISLAAGRSLQRQLTNPIIRLAGAIRQVTEDQNLTVRVAAEGKDELGALCAGFNNMLDQLEANRAALSNANEQLEERVATRTNELQEAVGQLKNEVSEHKRTQAERERLYSELMDASRQAGMAEIATNVLHNVGNILNSVNVSVSLLLDKANHSRAVGLEKLRDLIAGDRRQFTEFVAEDPKGKQLPEYISALADAVANERAGVVQELQQLTQHVDHMKQIVATQQNYARLRAVIEPVIVGALIEDALRIASPSLSRRGIAIERSIEDCPPVTTDRHKVLQILVNLLSNAGHAVAATKNDGYVRISVACKSDHVVIEVRDNGVGISQENQKRLFMHGFTTRVDGHGFGLHSAALTARELGASLRGDSEGPGRGATFALKLPRDGSVTSKDDGNRTNAHAAPPTEEEIVPCEAAGPLGLSSGQGEMFSLPAS